MEIFKEINGYEGYYLISNQGDVKSVKRNKILKCAIVCGYKCVNLYANGKNKMHKVHRLVAEAFIPNPNNLPQVNHKDENKLNNCVENLEWCDSKYNNAYGTKGKRISESISGANHYLYGKNHTEEFKHRVSEKLKGRPSPYKGRKHTLETLEKMSEAHKNISEETRNKMRANYLKRKDELVKMLVDRNKRSVKQFDKEGNLVREWDSIKEAADSLSLNSPNIIACCNNRQKTCGGYVWKY